MVVVLVEGVGPLEEAEAVVADEAGQLTNKTAFLPKMFLLKERTGQ